MRRAKMIRRKDPGPCKYPFHIDKALLITSLHSDDDEIGPVVLSLMLASAIVVNFGVKLYDLAT